MNPMLLLYSVAAMAGAAPTAVAPVPAALRADSDSVLTVDAFDRMFKIAKLLDTASVMQGHRQNHPLRHEDCPVGDKLVRHTEGADDYVKWVAEDSTVAGLFKKVGMTPQQLQFFVDLYRSALLTNNIEHGMTQPVNGKPVSKADIKESAMETKNIELIRSQPAIAKELNKMGWTGLL
jgi:hypothetical protein